MHSATVSGAVWRVAQEMGARMRSPATNLTGLALTREERRLAVTTGFLVLPAPDLVATRLGAMRLGVIFFAVILRGAAFLDGAMRLAGVMRLGEIFFAEVFPGVAFFFGAMRFATIFRAVGLDAARADVFAAGFFVAGALAAAGAARRPAATKANRVKMRVAVRIVTVPLGYTGKSAFV